MSVALERLPERHKSHSFRTFGDPTGAGRTELRLGSRRQRCSLSLSTIIGEIRAGDGTLEEERIAFPATIIRGTR